MLLTSISLSEQFADMPDDRCRLIATWTIPHLDREGRVTASPRRLRALVCPLLDCTDADVAKAIEAMCAGADPLAVRYTDDSGCEVLWFPKFRQQQGGATLDREAPSRYGAPAKSLDSDSCMQSHVTTCLARAGAGALTSLPLASLSGPSDARDPGASDPGPQVLEITFGKPDPASVQTAPPDKGIAAALVAIWPELREDIEGQLSVWADAHRGIDFVQLAKEAKAKARAQRRKVDNAAAYLTGWFQRAANEVRASQTADFQAEHAKRKAREAEEARLEKALRVPSDAKPVQVGQLLAALTKGVGHE